MIRIIKDENIIRKRWLISFYIKSFVGWILSLVGFLFFQSEAFKSKVAALDIYTVIATISFFVALNFISFVFYIYFAYKKSGTKLLLLHLIYTPIVLIYNFVHTSGLTINLKYRLLMFMISLPLEIYLWINSYKLYKLNEEKKDYALLNEFSSGLTDEEKE